jgi:hypothetical protein
VARLLPPPVRDADPDLSRATRRSKSASPDAVAPAVDGIYARPTLDAMTRSIDIARVAAREASSIVTRAMLHPPNRRIRRSR